MSIILKDKFWINATIAIGDSETEAIITKGYKLIGFIAVAPITGAQIRSKVCDTISGTLIGVRISNGASAASVPITTPDKDASRYYTVFNENVYRGAAKLSLVATDASGNPVPQTTAAATFKLLFEEQ